MGRQRAPRLGIRAFESWCERQLESSIDEIWRCCISEGGEQPLAWAQGQYFAVECAIFRATGQWIPTYAHVTDWCRDARAEQEQRRQQDDARVAA